MKTLLCIHPGNAAIVGLQGRLQAMQSPALSAMRMRMAMGMERRLGQTRSLEHADRVRQFVRVRTGRGQVAPQQRTKLCQRLRAAITRV